jgi:type IV pilus biogenesis protein CpaD/CtpE
MISKIVLPMLLISCLAGCAAQDSYSKTLGLPDTTESQKE